MHELILGTNQLCRAAVVRTLCGRPTHLILKLHPLDVNARNPALQEEIQKTLKDNLTRSQRPLRKAAFAARDAITVYLIDEDQN